MAYVHIPVMLKEVLEYLQPKPGNKFIDGTLGGAGYTIALAQAIGPRGQLISLDLDELAINNAAARIKEESLKNVILVKDNFKNLKTVIAENFPTGTKFNGIVFDLGLSSAQLEDEERGFSFKGARPLDMAFGPGNEKSTEEIVNHYPLLELTRIFREYGEERQAYRIAKAIVEARKTKRLKTTVDLINIIAAVIPPRFYHKVHPATKIFQALRMETNEELKVLEEVLPSAVDLLAPGGRLVVVSFHSGEDRIIKRFFKANSELQILTKKPLIPTDAEISSNPRARSAKLRAANKFR